MTTMLREGIPIALIEKINESMIDLGINATGHETFGINFTDGVRSLCQDNVAELLQDLIFYLKNQIFKVEGTVLGSRHYEAFQVKYGNF